MASTTKNFYFTFGTASHFPFGISDYVLVKAADVHDACATFRKSYPDHNEGLLNCADYYPEEMFNEFKNEYYQDKGPSDVLISEKVKDIEDPEEVFEMG